MKKNLSGSNISEKYKCEWVAPERTGSRKVAEILSYLGFKNNGHLVYYFNSYSYLHSGPNEKYKDYILISNARNPYGRTYSVFKNFYPQFRDKNKENFKAFLLDNNIAKTMIINPVFYKKPDYIIRLEHISEDLMKLPFIFDVLTENQINLLSSHGKPIEDWEQFYDEETKEIVYDMVKHHFLNWGYER